MTRAGGIAQNNAYRYERYALISVHDQELQGCRSGAILGDGQEPPDSGKLAGGNGPEAGMVERGIEF